MQCPNETCGCLMNTYRGEWHESHYCENCGYELFTKYDKPHPAPAKEPKKVRVKVKK